MTDTNNRDKTLKRVFAGLFLMELLAAVDTIGVTVLMPTLQKVFQLDKDMSGLILVAYILPFTLGLVPFGWLADKTGPVRILRISIISFGIFSLLCALAPNLELFLLFRFYKGLSAAGMFATEFAILIKYWRNPWKTFELAVMGMAIGVILGPVAASGFASAEHWRGFFLIGSILSLIGFVLYMAIDKIKPVERKADKATADIPKNFMGRLAYLCKAMIWGILLNLVISIAIQGVNVNITLYVQDTLGKPAWFNGLILMTIALGMVISNGLQLGSTIGEALQGRLGGLKDIEIAAWGSSLILAGVFLLLPLTNWVGYYVFPIYLLCGMLLGIPLASIELMVLRNLKTDVLALGNGIIVAVMQLGYVIGSLVMPLLFFRGLKENAIYILSIPILVLVMIFTLYRIFRKEK